MQRVRLLAAAALTVGCCPSVARVMRRFHSLICDVHVRDADWFGVESFTRRIAELAIHQAKKHNVPLKRAADVGMHSKMGLD